MAPVIRYEAMSQKQKTLSQTLERDLLQIYVKTKLKKA